MAADVSGEAGALLPAEQHPTQPTHAESPPPEPMRPHRFRFLTVYALLAAALSGAAVAGVVFGRRTISPAPAWSAWRPHGGGLGAAKNIAAHLAPGYRLPSGKQLVDVITSAPSVSPDGKTVVPIAYVSVRGTKRSPDGVFPISSTDSVMFSLCGLGPACSIATGTASAARGRLVRREVLELALYTFRYASGMKNVIAFLPPKKGQRPQYAVFLQRDDLKPMLSRPLAETLAPKAPLPNAIRSREATTIDGTTEPRVYTYSLAQTPQNQLAIVFKPLPA